MTYGIIKQESNAAMHRAFL